MQNYRDPELVKSTDQEHKNLICPMKRKEREGGDNVEEEGRRRREEGLWREGSWSEGLEGGRKK